MTRQLREITSHHVNACNKAICIEAGEKIGAGGTPVLYEINWTTSYDSAAFGYTPLSGGELYIRFQDGPITTDSSAGTEGVNGVTHEVLLAVLIDRLEGFQRGPYRCKENASALTHLNRAMKILNSRTQRRMTEGTEGTHTV